MKSQDRKDRQRIARAAVIAHEQKHPRIQHRGGSCCGPATMWDDLLEDWWTAAEWLARWKRGGEKHAVFHKSPGGNWRRACPPRPWINPSRTTLRGGVKSRRLP